MILINLLPHREARRRRQQRAFYGALGLALLSGAIAAGLWALVLEQATATQRARNERLVEANRKLDQQIKDVATLSQEIEALKARQAAVENLQHERNQPVRMLDELARQTPEGVYLVSLKQDGNKLTIKGYAQTNERVSELLRHIGSRSPWLDKPELVEIRATTPPRESRRVFDFVVRLQLRAQAGPAEALPAAPAASAARPAGGA